MTRSKPAKKQAHRVEAHYLDERDVTAETAHDAVVLYTQGSVYKAITDAGAQCISKRVRTQ